MTTRQLLLDRAKWLMGWMSIGELSFLAEIASELPENSIIYEIGSFCGRSTRAIADNAPEKCKIYCIDPWDYKIDQWDFYGNPLEPIIVDGFTHEQFCINLNDHIYSSKVRPVRHKWSDFTPNVDADFIFIDGNHEYEEIKHDIQKALKYVKPNGIIAGHDYPNFGGVRRAVDECFQKIEVRETIWCIREF